MIFLWFAFPFVLCFSSELDRIRDAEDRDANANCESKSFFRYVIVSILTISYLVGVSEAWYPSIDPVQSHPIPFHSNWKLFVRWFGVFSLANICTALLSSLILCSGFVCFPSFHQLFNQPAPAYLVDLLDSSRLWLYMTPRRETWEANAVLEPEPGLMNIKFLAFFQRYKSPLWLSSVCLYGIEGFSRVLVDPVPWKCIYDNVNRLHHTSFQLSGIV